MPCNVPAGAGTAPHERRCLAPLLPAPEEANRELLVPVVRPRAQPHLGRRPLRSPLTMPSPTRALTVADVHRFVAEQVFPSPAGDGPAHRQVGIELEWITLARDGRI